MSHIAPPKIRHYLPNDGKVTGTFVAVYIGNDRVSIATDGAHINDDNPAIEFRGESFLVHVFGTMTDGVFTVDDDYRHCTRRSSWSDAPPSFVTAICKAIEEFMPTVWDEDAARQGEFAAANNDVDLWEWKLNQMREEMREPQANLRAAKRRLKRASS